MHQSELSAAAAEGKGTDPFAEVRAQHPEDRLMLFRDRRTGRQFTLRVPPGSPWYPLLPPEQEVEIRPTDEHAS